MAIHKFSLTHICNGLYLCWSYNLWTMWKDWENLKEKAESTVRNLKTLDVDLSSYWNLLVPLINATLLNKLRLLISRKSENKVWLFPDLLKHLKTEIKAKESSVSLGHLYTERIKTNSDNKFKTFSLLTSEDSWEETNRKRVFCNSMK